MSHRVESVNAACGAIGVPAAAVNGSRCSAMIRTCIGMLVAGSPVTSGQATPTDDSTS
jgi:hypothetical protein